MIRFRKYLGGAGNLQERDSVMDEDRHPMRGGAHNPTARLSGFG